MLIREPIAVGGIYEIKMIVLKMQLLAFNFRGTLGGTEKK